MVAHCLARHRSLAHAIRVHVATLVIFAVATSAIDLAQGPKFARGEPVREVVTTPDNGPTRRGMLVTVVAVPGDEITVENDRLRVNGRPVEGFSPDLVAMVARSNRLPKRIGEGYYLVMGEYVVSDGDVVRKWGTYKATALELATVSNR